MRPLTLVENGGDRSWISGHLVCSSQVASSNDLWGSMLEASSVSFNGAVLLVCIPQYCCTKCLLQSSLYQLDETQHQYLLHNNTGRWLLMHGDCNIVTKDELSSSEFSLSLLSGCVIH